MSNRAQRPGVRHHAGSGFIVRLAQATAMIRLIVSAVHLAKNAQNEFLCKMLYHFQGCLLMLLIMICQYPNLKPIAKAQSACREQQLL